MADGHQNSATGEPDRRPWTGQRPPAPGIDAEAPGASSRAAEPNGAVPDVVLMLRPDGTIAFANRTMGGLDANEVLGRSIYEYLADDARDVVRGQLRDVFRERRNGACEVLGLGPAAPDRWYECRFSPTVREGLVVTATAVIRDVTARRAREAEVHAEREALRRRVEKMVVELAAAKVERKSGDVRERTLDERLAQFRALLESAGEAIFVTDSATGQLVDVNETACRWLRLGRDQIIGRTPGALGIEFSLLASNDDEPEFTDTRAADRPIVMGGGRHRRRDRTTYPVEVSVTRHQYGGRQYVLATVRDVQDRERPADELQDSERVYRALFDWSGDAVFLTTRDGALLDANSAALALFGYDRDAFLRLNARELYGDASDIRRFREEVSQGGVVRELELSLKRSDGGTFRARLSAVPRRRGDDSIRGYQCMVRPIEPAALLRGSVPGAGVYPRGAILIVDADEEWREESRVAFAKAGMRPLLASDLAEAADVVAQPGSTVRAVLLDAAIAESGAPAFVAAVRRVSVAPIVLVTTQDGGTPLERESWVAAVVRRPIHPLALLQAVWEALTSHGGG